MDANVRPHATQGITIAAKKYGAREAMEFMSTFQVSEAPTTKAQRPGPRDATIANYNVMPGSLKRM